MIMENNVSRKGFVDKEGRRVTISSFPKLTLVPASWSTSQYTVIVTNDEETMAFLTSLPDREATPVVFDIHHKPYNASDLEVAYFQLFGSITKYEHADHWYFLVTGCEYENPQGLKGGLVSLTAGEPVFDNVMTLQAIVTSELT